VVHFDAAAYTTPSAVHEINETVTLIGESLGIFGVVLALVAGIRKWWHRKRDRQEQTLVKHLDTLKTDLVDYIDEKHDGLNVRVDATAASVENLKVHIDTVVEPLVDRQLRIESGLTEHLQRHIA
jgi:hypothetical protein